MILIWIFEEEKNLSVDILNECKRTKIFDLDLNVWFGVKTHMYPQTSCCGHSASLKYLSLPGPVYTNPPCPSTSEIKKFGERQLLPIQHLALCCTWPPSVSFLICYSGYVAMYVFWKSNRILDIGHDNKFAIYHILNTWMQSLFACPKQWCWFIRKQYDSF